MRETWVQSLGWEDALEKEMATHSSILAWRISWLGEPGRLPSTGLQRIGHNWVTSLSLSFHFNFFYIYLLFFCEFFFFNVPEVFFWFICTKDNNHLSVLQMFFSFINLPFNFIMLLFFSLLSTWSFSLSCCEQLYIYISYSTLIFVGFLKKFKSFIYLRYENECFLAHQFVLLSSF